MSNSNALQDFLSRHYLGLRLESSLLYQWPVALRFDLGGIATLQRAVALYEASFRAADDCLVVSQDWRESTKRSQSLFQLPKSGLKDNPEVFAVDPVADADQSDYEEMPVYTGVVQPARSFRYGLVLEAVANSDFAAEPSVSSRVYFCNLCSAVVFHMYDDRGLDVIAPDTDAIRHLYVEFNDWILAYDRAQIEAAFR